jgi:hypothetical protein
MVYVNIVRIMLKVLSFECIVSKQYSLYRIWGSHSGSYECCHPLGCNVMYSVCEPTFWRNVSPPSSRSIDSRARNQRASGSYFFLLTTSELNCLFNFMEKESCFFSLEGVALYLRLFVYASQLWDWHGEIIHGLSQVAGFPLCEMIFRLPCCIMQGDKRNFMFCFGDGHMWLCLSKLDMAKFTLSIHCLFISGVTQLELIGTTVLGTHSSVLFTSTSSSKNSIL